MSARIAGCVWHLSHARRKHSNAATTVGHSTLMEHSAICPSLSKPSTFQATAIISSNFHLSSGWECISPPKKKSLTCLGQCSKSDWASLHPRHSRMMRAEIVTTESMRTGYSTLIIFLKDFTSPMFIQNSTKH